MRNKLPIFFLYRSSILIIILSVLSCTLNGCSGCSRSGIRYNQQRRSYSNTKSPKKNVRLIDASKKINSSERNHSHTNKILPLNELYNKYKNSVFLIYTSDGIKGFQGTGFFISKSGIAISNYHVFKGTIRGLEIIETYNDKKLKIKKVLSKSEKGDYIIFKVKLSGYYITHPIPISYSEPQIGEDVFAIGNPRGLEGTLSKGIISGYRNKRKLIQTTTEITHGSSGGPLLNMKGEVVGITCSGIGEADINFAVNIKQLPLQQYNLNN